MDGARWSLRNLYRKPVSWRAVQKNRAEARVVREVVRCLATCCAKCAPSSAARPREADAAVAKNNLEVEELRALNRIVNAYLEFAELQALNRRPMTMQDLIGKLDDFLRLGERDILPHRPDQPRVGGGACQRAVRFVSPATGKQNHGGEARFRRSDREAQTDRSRQAKPGAEEAGHENGRQGMSRHVNAIAGSLSLRPPQRRSLELLNRIAEVVPPTKKADVATALGGMPPQRYALSHFGRVFDQFSESADGSKPTF